MHRLVTESLFTECCRALKLPCTLNHISGHPFVSTFLKDSCREMDLFLYEKMLSVSLTIALCRVSSQLRMWILLLSQQDFGVILSSHLNFHAFPTP